MVDLWRWSVRDVLLYIYKQEDQRSSADKRYYSVNKIHLVKNKNKNKPRGRGLAPSNFTFEICQIIIKFEVNSVYTVSLFV